MLDHRAQTSHDPFFVVEYDARVGLDSTGQIVQRGPEQLHRLSTVPPHRLEYRTLIERGKRFGREIRRLGPRRSQGQVHLGGPLSEHFGTRQPFARQAGNMLRHFKIGHIDQRHADRRNVVRAIDGGVGQ